MNKIHIACNIDENYVQHCAVMLTSLFVNNHDLSFEVHIIASQLTEQSVGSLNGIAQQYDQNISFYFGHEEFLKDCAIIKSDSYLTVAAYYRCFLADILPVHIHKVLYLDSDLIVRHSIAKLWNMDISQYPLACVEDMWSGKAYHYERLHYSPEYSYFNSGVLLINLDYWRIHNITQKSLQYIKENAENLLFNDQDVLNGLFHASKLFIPVTWNMQDGFYRCKRKTRNILWEEIDRTVNDPVILHYTCSKKPWHDKSQHPLKSEYFKYLDMTPWKGWRPPVDHRYRRIERLNSVLRFFGILKHKYIKIKRSV